MKVILCIDDQGGVRFAGHRLTQDRLQRQDVIKRYRSAGFCMKKETASLYGLEESEKIHYVHDWNEARSYEGWWICEDVAFLRWIDQLEELVLYRWNRRYPSDERFQMSMVLPLWRCVDQYRLEGSSHAEISVEHYVRGEREQ